eukprot:1548434-Alexandrium_andersonii.AAC.1
MKLPALVVDVTCCAHVQLSPVNDPWPWEGDYPVQRQLNEPHENPDGERVRHARLLVPLEGGLDGVDGVVREGGLRPVASLGLQDL